MNSNDFDNEVSKLYQQRKAQIIAPKTPLIKHPKNRQLSPTSLLAVFSVAGVASFGIMAIMSHLSKPPVKAATLHNMNHQVEITKIAPIEGAEKTTVIPQPLPKKPIIKQPIKRELLRSNKQVNTNLVALEGLTTAPVRPVILAQLKKTRLAIRPIYKVLPKYSFNSLQDKQSGEIQLKYQITPAGTVENIIIIDSSVNRTLQQSAKKALAKWQYTPSNSFRESYEVIFEFKADQN